MMVHKRVIKMAMGSTYSVVIVMTMILLFILERLKFGTMEQTKIVLVIVTLTKMVMVKNQTNMVGLTVMIPMPTSIPKV